MAVTAFATIMIMAAYFLVLYGAVGFIQDKRLFSSAPKEFLAVIGDKRERFPGAHAVGCGIVAFAILMFAGAVSLAVYDGVKNGFGFCGFLARFLTMLYCMEIYDILFFDWFLLCRSNFYPHFYPELEGMVSTKMFGFNRREHIIHFIVYVPLCACAAWVCTLI